MKSILDRSFKYKTAAETDLKVTFARIRREQKEAAAKAAKEEAAASLVIRSIPFKAITGG